MAKYFLCAMAGALLFSSQAVAGNLLFILDASGSMWGKIDGQFKIDVAKSTLSDLVGQLPADSKYGVMVYGHRYDRDSPDSCGDIELFSAVGQTDPASVRAWLKELNPKGQTPMAGSLLRSGDAFVGLEEQNNNVVLISDGKETCEGDPCAVAGSLARSGINVRIHVVGFDVGAEEREQLECIAQLGGGQYFSADSMEGFTKAVSDAILVAIPEPTPEPKREQVFIDEFDGSGLAAHWAVMNPSSDAYLVENGKLLLFSSSPSGLQDPQMANIVTLDHAFPDGDWDVIVKFSGEFSSGRDQFWVGLRTDEQNFLAASFSTHFNVADDYHGDQISLNFEKRASGEETRAQPVNVFAGSTDEQYASFMANVVKPGATLTLSKRGRTYSTKLTVDGISDENNQPVVWATDGLTSLRSPGSLVIGTSLYEKANGESLAFVDSVEIVKISE